MGDPYSILSPQDARTLTIGAPASRAPAPGFFDTIGKSFEQSGAGADWGWNQTRWEAEAIGEVETALTARGWRKPSATLGEGDRAMGAIARQQRIVGMLGAAAEIRASDPSFLPDYDGVNDSDALAALVRARRRDKADTLGVELQDAGTIPWLVGALGHGLRDPLSFLPVGGQAARGTSTALSLILRTAAREGAANAGVALLTEPLVQRDAAGIGQERGAGDALLDISVQGLTGLAIGGGAKGLELGAGPIVDTLAPDFLRNRDAARLGKAMNSAIRASTWDVSRDGTFVSDLLSPSKGYSATRAAEAGTVATRGAVDAFTRSVPPELRTPEEQAAVHAATRGADVSEASPMHATPEADDAHHSLFDQALDALHRGTAVPDHAATVPPPRPEALPRHAAALSQDAVIRFVINDLEGGAAVVHYNQADGGTTKYGVAAKFNPGVDVANLSEGQAIGIARSNYWRPEYDRADPRVAAVAFDAGYIGGPKKMGLAVLDASGGDPVRAIAAYRAALNRIADTVPGKAKYRKGWNNRVDKLARRLGVGSDAEGAARSFVLADHDGEARAPFDGSGGEAEFAAVRSSAIEEALGGGGIAGMILDGQPLPLGFERFDPRDIEVDAGLMQFKHGGDAMGVTDSYARVHRWNPGLADPVTVWESAGGRRVIADGHQRHGIARRSLERYPDHPVEMAAFVMREAEGYSAQDARVYAAFKNIAQGHGGPLDFAKLLAETNGVLPVGIDTAKAALRDARGIVKLEGQARALTFAEQVRPDFAGIVGNLVPNDEGRQLALMHLLMETDPANLAQATSIVRDGIAAGFVEGEQGDMFGGPTASSKYLSRAQILDDATALLRKRKLVHSTAVREADMLEASGSTIAVGKSQREADANAQAIDLIAKLAGLHGPVSAALDGAVNARTLGVKRGVAARQFADDVAKLDLDALIRGEGPPAGGAGDGIGAERYASDAAARDASAPGGERDPAVAAAVDAAFDEAAASGSLFDDPVGAAARSQSDMLEHDVRMLLDAEVVDPSLVSIAEAPDTKDLWRLSQEQLIMLRDEKKMGDDAKLVKALGEDGAKRFKSLDRTQNSMDPKRADEASRLLEEEFGKLTPEQERLVYGIGETDASLDDLDQLILAHSDMLPGDGDIHAGYMAAVAARKTSPAEMADVAQGKGSVRAQADFVRMGKAMQELAASGVAQSDIPAKMAEGLIRQGGWTPEQAGEIVQSFVDGTRTLTEEVRPAKALPDPTVAARHRQEAALRAASPMRPGAVDADGVMGLGLFDAADQPLFTLEAGQAGEALPDIFAALDEEAAAAADLRACLLPKGTGL